MEDRERPGFDAPESCNNIIMFWEYVENENFHARIEFFIKAMVYNGIIRAVFTLISGILVFGQCTTTNIKDICLHQLSNKKSYFDFFYFLLVRKNIFYL